uniref:Sodium/calcium exchanger 1 n=1 Tax=Parastrongyloides trichosuri TaxID=131310 RepID=A0A0N4ZSW9_PARTI
MAFGRLSLGLVPIVLLVTIIYLSQPVEAGTNCSAADATRNCIDGLIVPIWRPFLDLTFEDRFLRGVIYFIIIAYMFLGVSIVADRFMSSIEVITSMERTVMVKRPGLEPMKVTVRIWNDTVSNLTLMALGSSAPEILLSIIEVVARGFEAGDLGPNTIVGSAAFNLFMIIAICVAAVPSTEIRRQKHLDVFFVTATWSVFAYIWLYLILSFFSPGVIEIWEGLLTFAFFPLTVLTAYIADIKIIQRRFLPRKYRRSSHGMIVTEGEEMKMLEGNGLTDANGYKMVPFTDNSDPAVKAFEEHRREFIETMREIRRKNPHIDPVELQKQAEYEMISKGPKTRAFYRVQATRRLIGGGDIVKKRLDKEHDKNLDAIIQAQEKQARQNTCRIFFDPAHYTVLENVGTFDVVVGRDGGPDGLTVMVDYYTEDGTANSGSDYIPVKGTLTFYPEDKHQRISIEIVDDDVFEEDEHFYLHLKNLRVRTKDGLILDPTRIGGIPVAQIETPATATIMILDDDHAGVYSFEHDHFQAVESCGHISVRVQRTSGCRGKVIIPYKTIDGTGVAGKHYEAKEGELVFEDNQTEAFVEIGVIDTEQYERSDFFFLELGPPVWAKKMSDLAKIQERFHRRMERKRESVSSSVEDKEEDERHQTRLTKKLEEWFSNNKKGDFAEAPYDLTQDQLEVAELGKPRLGEYRKCQVTIKESKEFQSVVDRMLKTANTSLMLGTSSWREQFIDALTVSAGDDDDDDDDEDIESKSGSAVSLPKQPTSFDYFMHFLCVPWKLSFATIPPTDIWGGWACFVVSIAMIGLLTALIGDLASQFGCWVGLKDAVTAITFVALGTSVPDTFASKVAAIQDKYADSSIGNVTGSNGVNVFLGIGIAWTMAAVYHWYHGSIFYVNPGTLAFSVTVFCIEAVICIAVIVLRRHKSVGGELGGPLKYKVLTSGFFILLWLIYIGLSSLESYCYIAGF